MPTCKNPYLGAPSGSDCKGFVNSKYVRQACTPFGCGQCMPCRINKSREWTNRMLLEQTMHADSCFLTLTYEDEKCPKNDDGTLILEKKDLQDFLKRLRYYKEPNQIRHFAVGEYGKGVTQRPHYHLALFGLSQFEITPIQKSWSHGFSYTGSLNNATARYIVGYVMKNLTKTDEEDLYGRPAEFMLSSRGTKSDQLGGLGRAAVRVISDQLKAQPWFKPRIIREIRQGGRKYPLGRYLTKKLADDLGVDDETWQKSLEDYQANVYALYMDGEKNYFQKIRDAKNGKAVSMEKRYKIYEQKRKI